jgi:hypothetical protein
MIMRKRYQEPLSVARAYLREHNPELAELPLRLRVLDGPPNAPRYAVTLECCPDQPCPHGMPKELALAGECPIRSCPLRHTLRLLLTLNGEVVQVTESDLHWGRLSNHNNR